MKTITYRASSKIGTLTQARRDGIYHMPRQIDYINGEWHAVYQRPRLSMALMKTKLRNWARGNKSFGVPGRI